MISRGANFRSLNDRLQRLEKKRLKCEEDQATEKKRVESRLMKGAMEGLNNDQLKHLVVLLGRWQTDPDAEPTPEQRAAFEAYLGHYQDFLTTGRVQTVRGHPVDYSGEWPEAAGTTVGYFVDGSWWIQGIGCCLDLHPPKASEIGNPWHTPKRN